MTSTLKKNKEGGKYRYIGRYLTTNRQVKKKKNIQRDAAKHRMSAAKKVENSGSMMINKNETLEINVSES